MRIWDLDLACLCDRHLLGEHRELHAIWSVLTTGKRGYRAHPETMRWRGRLAALYARHDAQVAEMRRRGFNHASPLDPRHATGAARQTELVDSVEAQRERLAQHACPCSRRRAADPDYRDLGSTRFRAPTCPRPCGTRARPNGTSPPTDRQRQSHPGPGAGRSRAAG